MDRFTVVCLSVFLGGVVAESNSESARDCPKEAVGFKSVGGSAKAKLNFVNTLEVEFNVFWVDFKGDEKISGLVSPEDVHKESTTIGHAFRVRAWTGELLLEKLVDKDTETISVFGCKDLNLTGSPLWGTGRDAEFESLVHGPISHPCLPEDKSGLWSCVKYWSREELVARNKSLYGFAEGEVSANRVHQTYDTGYVHQIPKMPKIVPGGAGYMKMGFTQKLKDLLLDWYQARKLDSMKVHEVIAGGYTNNDKVEMGKVNLDEYRHVQRGVAKEMQEVLQWWTRKKLKHTSTFGVRVYKRGSMLIDHVDRQDTHLASAVLQLHQEVDEDGGWPLEVLLPDGRAAEVYLKPGEMVLYEGSWLRHGRPMRLKGDEFANVFTHFAPLDWKGQFPYDGGYGYARGRCETFADGPGHGCHVEAAHAVKDVDLEYPAGSRFASEKSEL